MKTKMKRIFCLALAALMLLFSFAACGGKKNKRSDSNGGNKTLRDQVVHEGETVQYGDLILKFEEQGIYRDEEWVYGYNEPAQLYAVRNYVYIKLNCEYKGESRYTFNAESFTVFADGEEGRIINNTLTDDIANVLKYEYGVDYSKYRASLTKDRSSDIWLVTNADESKKKIEFDYVNHEYAEKWGKVTFVVDCSDKSKDAKKDGKKNENTIVGTWELDLDATYADQDTLDFVKSSGFSMSFTFNADGTGTVKMYGNEGTPFEYKIENNQIVIEDEGVDYTLNGNKLTLDMNGEKMIFNRK